MSGRIRRLCFLSALLLVAVMMWISTAQAMAGYGATPTITLTPVMGSIGQRVTVSSSNFASTDGPGCSITFSSDTTSWSISTSGSPALVGACGISDGSLTGSYFVVPTSPPQIPGPYTVTVTSSTNPSDSATALFQVGGGVGTGAFSISFNPTLWECNGPEYVTFSGPLQAGNSQGTFWGDTLNFVFTQEGTGNGYQTNTFMTIPETFYSDNPPAFMIPPSDWSSINFAYMPTVYVSVADVSKATSTISAPVLINGQNVGQPFGCTQNEYQSSSNNYYTTQVMSTQTMRLTSTSTLFTTMVTTTTGYATTQVSTTGESIYVTEVERSYGTITNTQYVYLTSSLNNSSTTAGGAGLNFGSLVAGVNSYVNGYLPLPLLELAGAGAILLLVSAFMMRRRRRGKVTEQTGDSTEMEATLLDYINAHNGMISMSQASEDLGVPREPLGEAIIRLKADGKLPQAWTHLKVGGE